MSSREDTIVAPITAAGSAAVSVVRVSGARVPDLIRSVCDRADDVLHAPRHTVYSTLRDADSGEPIDQGLAVFFQAPNSFTGEDTLELHVHGSPYILRRVLEGCRAFGIR
ncbi:MAG: tRNA uridine-5-carboxymethylaminomethyl(34) synthesis GTPase MnmE, partial [Deltaproteobacteria bacterium]|nr:tRNA uridine-5-carboxymethylaminomethyl(34) synthesis GTPase MnmE [Deltaproteobacteria bacterium]